MTGEYLKPLEAEEVICRLALEKMADSLEDGTGAFLGKGEAKPGPAVREACWFLAKKFAGIAREKDCAARFATGPYCGLSFVAGIIGNDELALARSNMERLVTLVDLARRIPIKEPVLERNEAGWAFAEALKAFTAEARERGKVGGDR